MQGSTICAISSPPGIGAIALIRLSGNLSFSIVNLIFQDRTQTPLKDRLPYSVHYGQIIDNNDVIDDVLISLFKNPKSFTGEDMVEISCHGSPYIQAKILRLLVDHGAEMALPGEFTMRAYMNGKMDLAQAEAVADIISSSSKAAHRIAMNQMKGGFSREIKYLREQLLNFASLIELELDFSEEDVEFADRSQLKVLVEAIKQRIEELLQSFRLGNAIKNGIPVAIVGKPNVGKSTLLNLLLKEDKAIVSDIPGTTRDAIEDVISINGYLFRFIDTAGIRETSDTIENLGIERTRKNIEKAAIILFMVEPGDDPSEIDSQIQSFNLQPDQELIILINKSDIAEKFQIQNPKYPSIPISAKQQINIQQLESAIIEKAHLKSLSSNDILLTNSRHYELLSKALVSVNRILDGINNNLFTDLLAMDMREALTTLGEITGEIGTEEVLGNIFKNFCIGK